MKKVFDLLIKILVIVRNFFEFTSLHGFKFIAEKESHPIERLVWSILCTLSWIGCGILFLESYTAFQENAVSFGVETTYLDFNTSFPAITICENDNVDYLYERGKELYGEDHDEDLDEVLRELAYFKNSAKFMKKVCNKGGIDCPKGNYSELVKKARASCEELIVEFMHNGKDYQYPDCCKHFVPIETELGTCFSFTDRNEQKLKDQGEEWIDTIATSHSNLTEIGFTLMGHCKIFLHSEYDVPYLNSLTTERVLTDYEVLGTYYITTTDIENPPELRELSIYQRKCRFPDENNLESADFYSYSSCIVDCRRRAQIELCNCTSHFMPKTKPEEHCDYDGIMCLDKYNSYLSSPKSDWSGKNSLVCDCLPGCADKDINIVYKISWDIEMVLVENSSMLAFSLHRMPTEKYKRNVVRGRLDLVVSIGGAAGLLLGASLLTVVEVIYYFIFRARTVPLSESELSQNEDEETLNEEEEPKLVILPYVH